MKSGLAVINEHPVDLIIMDIGLPDGDGRDVIKQPFARRGFQKPVILLTGQDLEHDVVRGLDFGANDYVSKPFRFSILLARIRAHIRQHEFSDDASFQIASSTSFTPGPSSWFRNPPNSSLLRKKLLSCNISIVPRAVWSREMNCCVRFGVITLMSRHIRWRRISIDCVKKLR